MLFKAISGHSAKTALREAGKTLTYGELLAEVQKRGERLSASDRISLELDNGIEWILWDLTALYAGAVCVPIPPFFTETQKNHAFKTAGITSRITPQGIIRLKQDEAVQLPVGTLKITFTSGTTGNPKGVCLSREGLLTVACSLYERMGEAFVGKHVSILPFAVLLENIAGVYTALIAGSEIRINPLSAFGEIYANLHQVLEAEQATTIILVPEILRLLMKQVMTQGPLNCLEFIAVGGSRVDPHLIGAARQMGLPVFEGYGLSECASVVALNVPGEDKPGTVGRLLPHVVASVREDEIVISNPTFLGYVGEPKMGEFATGDLGSFDEDGYLSIDGRKKNVLITSYGRNVSPEWVESTLLLQPDIAQAVVFGDGEPHLRALVVPSHPQANVKRAIMLSNELLPVYAQIHHFTTVPPFTLENGLLTGTGRPKRDQILAANLLETGEVS
ncbi:AMP-binding protein [Sneathiella limimaris]|uniref:AMP-binding protein n=1 Tax=Sneathiella limimaris TaxID=1964213 RepID=UPI00146BBEBB|nr:AMP-binding protein [Sneathiella limimaris]